MEESVIRRHGMGVRGGVAVLLFSAGALLGLALLAVAALSDLEGATFDPAIRGQATLWSLKCPVLISTSESGVVRAKVGNSLDRPLQYLVRVHISEGYVTLFREIDYHLPLDPGQTQTIKWEVSADDAAYGFLVLVKVIQFGSYPEPSRSGTCGIPVVPIPYLSGNQFFALLCAASVLAMGLGIGLWRWAGRAAGSERRDVTAAMLAEGAVILLGTGVAVSGIWLLSILFLAGTLLLTMALVFYFLFKVA